MLKDSLNIVNDTLSLAAEKEEILNAAKPENVKEGIIERMESFSDMVEKTIVRFLDAIPAIVAATIGLIVGLLIIRFLLKIIHKRFEKRNVDLSLRDFLMSIIKFILYALLLLTIAGNLGFKTTAILGALSGLVLAAGLALQGSLSNFAGGVLILLFRPFDVGDYIENSAGTEGTVEKIDLLYTTLNASNGIKIFSPNGTLANSVIRNFSKISKRRIEFFLTVSYADNIQSIQQVIEDKLAADKRVLKEPKPQIFVKELASNGVVLTIQVWASKTNYGSLNFEIQDEIKKAIYEGGFNNPFAATPIRIINETPEK
ncbi:small conductance mechanosensitive channel [Paenimyroides aquimaris]|uniref:Small conductance mechanosensitive channel n=1 Tax=Paenimyroides marinum TaxID=1159016 RepID=A0A1H6LNR6_9FLAO|nr:mechanosensitive ion channel domain-containing protein [Paenimyroides aquimaris]SEH87059.1 small conductance mechanosensitive channel [Paenimyroides aquimaris]